MDLEAQAAHLRTLRRGWDNHRGLPIDERAIEAALNLLRSTPHLTPTSGGGVQIDWPTGEELEFAPNGTQVME